MNVKDLTTLIVSVIVSLLVVVTILVPIVETATDNTTTYTNSGTVLLREVDDSETLTGSIDAQTQTVIVNGVAQSIDYYHERSAVILAENCMIGYGWRSDDSMVLATDYWSGTQASHITGTQDPLTMSFVVNADHSIDLTVTYESGDATVTIPPSDWMLVKDDNGDLVQVTRYYGGTVYTDSLDNIYAGSWTFVNSYQFGVAGEVATVNGSNATVVWDATPVMNGVLSVDIGYTEQQSYVEFTKTDSTVTTANIQTVVVPLEVEGNTESNIILNSILYVLPVFATIGILLSVVLIFRRS